MNYVECHAPSPSTTSSTTTTTTTATTATLPTYRYVLILYGFIVGFVMACVTANSVYSAVATVYVAFAESHVALQNNHPDTFYRLYEAWNHFHPQLVTYIVVQQQVSVGSG